MPLVDTNDLISVTEANTRGVSYLVTAAEGGREHVILRNNRPAAVMVGITRFEHLRMLEDSLADVTILTARIATSSPQRTPLDDVLQTFGYTREELAEADAEEV